MDNGEAVGRSDGGGGACENIGQTGGDKSKAASEVHASNASERARPPVSVL